MRFPMYPLRSAGRGLLAAVVGIALVVPSVQASGDSVWAECVQGNGVSTNHSQSDFQSALANPPADGNEYSDCSDQIRAAQLKASRGGGGSGSPGGGGTGTGGTGGSAPSAGAPAVAPAALQRALADSGINPAAPAASGAPAPAPVEVGGEKIDLSSERLPSLGGALSLPLPLAASAVVVLLSAVLPIARYIVARFGGPPTGTTSTSP